MWQVTNFNSKFVYYGAYKAKFKCGYENIGPVKLSPGILVKLGFDPAPNNSYSKDRFGLRLIPNTGVIPDMWEFGVACTDLRDIQYVHELQRLLLALTGGKLTIEL